MIQSKSIIFKHGDVACLFNQKVQRYVTEYLKCQMPVNNVLVNYGTR